MTCRQWYCLLQAPEISQSRKHVPKRTERYMVQHQMWFFCLLMALLARAHTELDAERFAFTNAVGQAFFWKRVKLISSKYERGHSNIYRWTKERCTWTAVTYTKAAGRQYNRRVCRNRGQDRRNYHRWNRMQHVNKAKNLHKEFMKHWKNKFQSWTCFLYRAQKWLEYCKLLKNLHKSSNSDTYEKETAEAEIKRNCAKIRQTNTIDCLLSWKSLLMPWKNAKNTEDVATYFLNWMALLLDQMCRLHLPKSPQKIWDHLVWISQSKGRRWETKVLAWIKVAKARANSRKLKGKTWQVGTVSLASASTWTWNICFENWGQNLRSREWKSLYRRKKTKLR